MDADVDVTLDDARAWLQRATALDPMNVEATLDLAIFLDVVDDRPDVAAPVFASALEGLVEHLETFADGLEGALSMAQSKVDERTMARGKGGEATKAKQMLKPIKEQPRLAEKSQG